MLLLDELHGNQLFSACGLHTPFQTNIAWQESLYICFQYRNHIVLSSQRSSMSKHWFYFFPCIQKNQFAFHLLCHWPHSVKQQSHTQWIHKKLSSQALRNQWYHRNVHYTLCVHPCKMSSAFALQNHRSHQDAFESWIFKRNGTTCTTCLNLL